jgi:ABC-type nitrate/sulfonate/bicarbonate transport system permease component
MNGAIAKTLTNTVLALLLALGAGIVAGALLHRCARAARHARPAVRDVYTRCRYSRSTRSSS